MPGVIAIQTNAFINYTAAKKEVDHLNEQLISHLQELAGVVMMIICDNANFTAENMHNYLWVTYTRCNPSHDIYGIDSFTEHKHFGCRGPLVIDARMKPHHAPPVQLDAAVEKSIEPIFEKGGSLYGK